MRGAYRQTSFKELSQFLSQKSRSSLTGPAPLTDFSKYRSKNCRKPVPTHKCRSHNPSQIIRLGIRRCRPPRRTLDRLVLYDAPPWSAVSGGAEAPIARGRGEELADPLRGWQRVAARASDVRICELHLANLPPASRALLLSQAGPCASRTITVLPTRYDLTIPNALFRVLLLRRVRLPLPLATCLVTAAATGCSTRSATTGPRAPSPACLPANLDSPISGERRIEVVAAASCSGTAPSSCSMPPSFRRLHGRAKSCCRKQVRIKKNSIFVGGTTTISWPRSSRKWASQQHFCLERHESGQLARLDQNSFANGGVASGGGAANTAIH